MPIKGGSIRQNVRVDTAASEPISLRVTVSDPWDFTTESGSNVFPFATGRPLSDGQDFPLVLDLGADVVTRQGSARFFVASARTESAKALSDLLSGTSIECSLVGISAEAAAAGTAAAAARSWRGGTPVATATLTLA